MKFWYPEKNSNSTISLLFESKKILLKYFYVRLKSISTTMNPSHISKCWVLMNKFFPMVKFSIIGK